MQIVRRMMCLLALLGMPFTVYGGSSRPLVKIDSGVVEGKEVDSVRVFLGIPYAAPPIGNLRWKPPAAPQKWSGARKTLAFAPRCMQGLIYSDMKFRDAGGNEDCLTLNVWTPAKNAGAKLPVMVWIHGGGFVAGASSEPRQDGQHLAQQGMVVVSMNYRLGIFGFLVHPQLARESGRNSSGNYGLLDQLAALQWVQKNISAFGGDPNNVTIFGESAGSFSVSALMASPLAKGLFQKCIGESGAAFSNRGMPFEPLAVREEKDSKAVNAAFGVRTLAELRALPAPQLLKPFGAVETGFAFDPDVDGYFLPAPVPAIFAEEKQNDVPLLAGWNRDEASFEPNSGAEKATIESMTILAQKEFGTKAAEFLRLYSAATDTQALRSMNDLAGDRFIAWSTWRWIEAQSTTGKQPVYRYRFDQALPTDPKEPAVGAYHSAEIEYVFGQLDSKTDVRWRKLDREVSAEMQKYWANFARSGDPNGAGLPKWPAYSSVGGWQVMHFEEKPEARKDDQRERYLFLTKAWAR